MSEFGPSRQFAAERRRGRFRREADINSRHERVSTVANDPTRTSKAILSRNCIPSHIGLSLSSKIAVPGKEKESNWLPAPEGTFSLYIQAYGATAAWKPPPIEKVK